MAKNIDMDSQETTNRLLRVMIALMIRREGDQPTSLKQQIELLDRFGMRPAEIAATLGRTPTHINKELSGIRKAK